LCEYPFFAQLLSPICNEEGRRLIITCYDCVHVLHGITPFSADILKAQIEALANAKPVIVPDQTWMANQLASSGAGITFKSGDLESLSLAVLGAVQKLPSLTRAARDASNKSRDFHNAKNMLHNYVLRTAGRPATGKQR